MTYREEFIEFMLEAGVLTFGDFVTKSGRNTPYFINTGNYKTGAQLSRLGDYYAACIKERVQGDINALYGPAYKGIPLAVVTAVSLFRNYNIDLPYTFNRKESKDHGEGGTLVGYKPVDGDKIVITEDVVTAGTALRENIPVLKAAADVVIKALIVSVDRMERGKGELSAVEEVKKEFGIDVYPIVTIREIVSHLHNRNIGGRVFIDDIIKERIENYLAQYGA